MDDLLKLPGVARKTANVVLAHAYGIHAGVTVDTHVKRLSQRLGFTKHTDPIHIERDLIKLVPQPDWENWSIRLIYHGRAVCNARNPACDRCLLADLCPSADPTKVDVATLQPPIWASAISESPQTSTPVEAIG
jgi:endonuclease-3